MAEKKYYSIKEAAEVLGLTPAEVNQMRERNELHAYRDGADWKFQTDQIEEKLAERIRVKGGSEESQEVGGDVLLSERELGASDSGVSGTVIGPIEGGGADSDIQLVTDESAGSDVDLNTADSTAEEADSQSVDEMDLTLDEDLALEDSEVVVDEGPKPASDSDAQSVDLTSDEALDDDDLVLGGSGTGSDITIGGDSGISLVDPADSGLSLEDPLDMGTGEESLELGEDDMLTLSEGEEESDISADLEVDSDFELTPLEEADDDGSESGSQVIALDTDAEGEEAPTMAADLGGEMPAMLDEDDAATAEFDLGAAEDAGPMPAPMLTPTEPAGPEAAGVPGMAAAPAAVGAVLPEPPYSIGVILGLTGCVVFLALTGMMCYDLLRNMWSWDAPYTINSSLMDLVGDLF